MYYIIKIIQALGLGIILFVFVRKFPELMSYQALGMGLSVFGLGYFAERFLLKRK